MTCQSFKCRAIACPNDATCGCAIPTSTPTTTPTPPAWIKIKNGSFQSDATLNNVIPTVVQAFDSSDDTSRQFIVGANGGTVVAPNINLGSSAVSATNGWKSTYSPRMFFDKGKALSYVESRKDHATVSSVPDQLVKDGIYVYNGNLTLNTAPSLTSNVVLIINGTVTINANIAPPAGKSFAIIADTITLNSIVTQLTGIYITDTLNTNTGAGLKVIGNIIVSSTLNNQRSQPGNKAPSIYISFDPTTYLNLLPYLSISKYEWRQLK